TQTPLNDGGRYTHASDSWLDLTRVVARTGRWLHTAVWTGGEMLIWGGGGYTAGNYFNDGARYNSVSNSWTAVAAAGAPSARNSGPEARRVGTEMSIRGG